MTRDDMALFLSMEKSFILKEQIPHTKQHIKSKLRGKRAISNNFTQQTLKNSSEESLMLVFALVIKQSKEMIYSETCVIGFDTSNNLSTAFGHLKLNEAVSNIS